MQDLRSVARWGAICGLLGTVVYVGLIVASQWMPGSAATTTAEMLAEGGKPENRRWIMMPHMTVLVFAMLWTAGMVALERVLTAHEAASARKPLGAAYFGRLFGVIGFATLAAMLIVQGAVMTRMAQMYVAATTDSERANIVTLYRGLRSIDLGLDLAWDGFIFVAIALMGWAMFRHPSFGKVLGAAGVVIGLSALAANTWTAPTPPAFDWGPVCGLWIVAVNIRLLHASRQDRLIETA